MWINKKQYSSINNDLVRLEKDLSNLRYRHQRLLDHLGLAEWETPPDPGKTEIITKEEWTKRNKENLDKQTNFQQLYGQGIAQQQGMREFGGLGRIF